MDPFTQATFGAIFAQTNGQTKHLGKAAFIGGLAALTPDLDVFICSADDPLLALEYHRHFTHALFFIPIGAIICATIFYSLLGRRWNISFKQIFIWCLIGIATHGLVDSLTSYGTQLFLPFSNERIAWDLVSIIDPLVTFPLLACVIVATSTKQYRYIILGIAWITVYLTTAFYQQQRALDEGLTLADRRGLTIEKIEVKPSFANILIWKLITTTNDTYYVDAVKIGWHTPKIWEGDSVPKLSVKRDLPWLAENTQQRIDIERFRWFSMDYLARDRDNPNRVVDMRYSLLPHQINPLWGIELSPDAAPDTHVKYYVQRNNKDEASKTLWDMITE